MTQRIRTRLGSAPQVKGVLFMDRAIPELSIDTSTIERLLKTAAIGDTVTYDVLTAAIGRNVQGPARGNLRTARIRLRRSDAMVFGAVTNIGIKRLNDEGKIAAAHSHSRRGRNQFKMARTTAAAVDDFQALPNHLKIEHNVIVAQAGALLHMTSPRATRKLEVTVGEAQKKFNPKESLQLMKDAI